MNHLFYPIRLHKQQGLYLAHVPAEDLFNHFEAEFIQDLASGQFYTWSGHLCYRISRCIQVTENGEGQRPIFWLWLHLADNLRNDAESSFCGGEEMGQFISEWTLGRSGSRIDHRSVSQDHF